MENQIKTDEKFDQIILRCQDIRINKRKDYGNAWKKFRPSSMTDQILIKALRIRSVQEKKENKVGDPLDGEFLGIINYSLMALYALDHRGKSNSVESNQEINEDDDQKFEEIVIKIKNLLKKKNHDYGEAWRDLRISSMVDLILVKLLRLIQIEANDYSVKISEEAFASYQDVINYCVFCLILIEEGKNPME
jgi:hypothetical protein